MASPIAQSRFRPFVVALAIVIAAASLILPAAPAHAQGNRTSRQMSALSPDMANRVSQEDLLSVLEPSGKIRLTGSPRRTNLVTKPYGTEFEGVCRRDLVSLLYAPAKAGVPSASARLRPYGIETTPMFRIVHLPKIVPGLDDLYQPLVAQPACQDVERQWRKRRRAEGAEDDETTYGPLWFTAPDVVHAVRAGFAVDLALAQVRAGTLKPEPCPDVERFGRTCLGQILATDLEDIYAVESCDATAGSVCYKVFFMDASAMLRIRALVDDGKIVPKAILSIAVEEFGCAAMRADGQCIL